MGPLKRTYTMDNSLSIFIADDNKINRLLLQSQLEDYCQNITLAADGKEALSYLQQYKYDLILLDIQMPYLSGLELVKIIKKIDSINQNTPVIAITAQIPIPQHKSLSRSEFDECLIKPILLEHLEELLEKWLAISPSENKVTTELTVDYISALLQRTSGNILLATTIFNKLFAELPEQLELINQAIKTENYTAAYEITHKLHGSVSFCGFSDLQIPAQTLEKSLFTHKKDLIHSSLDQLNNKITDLMEQQNSILKQLSLL